jgi:NAD(P) transhydrogenase subunit alpha
MAEQAKPILIGIPKESYPGERRVAMVPDVVPALLHAGAEVRVEPGAGLAAGFADSAFAGKGAKIASGRDEVFSQSDIVLQVRTYGANAMNGKPELSIMRRGLIVVGFTESLSEPRLSEEFARAGVTLFSLELLPRITRAQSMDVLSSMATIAGYKAVLLAANHLPKLFPMFMTAAGTIAAARVFVIGAGVAGLQAIATAKRLGAVVSGYDVRSTVKEQIESLGAKFVELAVSAGDAQDKGGYAKEMGEEFYKKQREMMKGVLSSNDAVITTAAVPGKKAPILVTRDMMSGMAPGSIIVDLAAERGGNCELTKPGETVEVGGVTILGPVNVPSMIPFHASQMYARNISTFVLPMIKNGAIEIDASDEIVRDTMITRDGDIVSPRVRELLGMQAQAAQER